MRSNQSKHSEDTAGQNAPAARAKKNIEADAGEEMESTSVDSQFSDVEHDPAHSPGHKKMNLKNTTEMSPITKGVTETKAVKLGRSPLVNRRVIGRAANGKGGRASSDKQ